MGSVTKFPINHHQRELKRGAGEVSAAAPIEIEEEKVENDLPQSSSIVTDSWVRFGMPKRSGLGRRAFWSRFPSFVPCAEQVGIFVDHEECLVHGLGIKTFLDHEILKVLKQSGHALVTAH